MIARYPHSVVACALTLAALACSREATQQTPRSEGPAMAPAAGPATPGAQTTRPGCAENFAAFDDDGDGRVSEHEFSARPHSHPDPASVFRDRDRDGDGSLSESEFCSGWRGAPRPQGAFGEPTRPGAGMGPKAGNAMGHRRMGGPTAGMRCEQHFDAFDADGDGKLTKDEFAAWPHARGDADSLFVERDRDRNGTLTHAEFCTPWR